MIRFYLGWLGNLLLIALALVAALSWTADWWVGAPTSFSVLLMALLGVGTYLKVCWQDAQWWRRRIVADRSFQDYMDWHNSERR